MLDPREALDGGAAGRLQEVVQAALGRPDAELGGWQIAPLHGGVGALMGESRVYRVTGTAGVGTAEQPWTVVLKVLAPVAGQDDPAHSRYWKREPLLYGSGLLDDLPAGMRALRCYGHDEPADGSVWLWLEHVQEEGERTWPLARWALAARHLGQLNGAYLAGRALPRAPWLGGGRMRSWLELYGPAVARIEAAPADPDVRRYWPRPVVDGIARLWRERDAFCAALERLPRTFCHGDANRRNLLARGGADGDAETVGIDWAYAGYWAVGEEIGQTLSLSSIFFDVDPADLPALDEALFAGYLAGLREAGWRGDTRLARLGHAAHAALRNVFIPAIAPAPDEQRAAALQQSQGRSWQDIAERWAAVRPFLLDRADEARHLMHAL